METLLVALVFAGWVYIFLQKTKKENNEAKNNATIYAQHRLIQEIIIYPSGYIVGRRFNK